jgi:diaminohydroxyphosphoribosylaminopyrimidine deaminase/5-amino-6-(5-phosphoribosylamino)uracil reductase
MAPVSPFMALALEAALSARGRTSPNPWVGAVLVRDGRVISTGATAEFGGPHAEAAALTDVDARGTTLYTTLEPCMPFPGKQTRPCVDAIIESGVARVVIGIEDPHRPVRSRGVASLREAGIEVDVGDGADEVMKVLRPYLKFRATGRPYVIAKFALSLDGRVGAPAAGIRQLTSSSALERAHMDRAWVDAILVGSGTVLSDDPSLTARPGGAMAARQPLRIILDGRGRVPPASRTLGRGAIVCTANSANSREVAATGAIVLQLESAGAGVNLDQMFQALSERNVMSMIAEGGPTLLSSLFAGRYVDEVHAYIAPVVLGGAGTPLAPAGVQFEITVLSEVVVETLPPDVLIRGYTGDWSPS